MFFLSLPLIHSAQTHYYTKGKTDTYQLKTSDNIYRGYLKSYLTDGARIFSSPLRWNANQWVVAGLSLGVGTAIFYYDEEIQSFFQRNTTETGRKITEYSFEKLGRGSYLLASLAGVYGLSYWIKNIRLRKVALMGIKSFVLSGVFVQFPKMLLNRHRPFHDTPSDPYCFEGLKMKPKDWYRSMPSGHTISAFSIATVFASEYQSTVWAPILSYGLASLVGVSRCYDNKHWASDVFIGAICGYAIGKLVYQSDKWNIKLYPTATSQSAGLNVSLSF